MNKLKTLSIAMATLMTSAVFASEATTFATDFSSGDTSKWTHTGKGSLTIENGVLGADALSVTTLNGTQLDSNYELSMTVDFEGQQGHSKGLLFGYKDASSPFYSVHLKSGTWGKLLVYKHEGLYSGQREVLYFGEEHDVDLHTKHVVKVKLEKDNVSVYLNGIKETEFIHYFGDSSNASKKVGMFSLGEGKGIENFVLHTPDNYETNFGSVESTNLEILSGMWTVEGNATHMETGIRATLPDLTISGDYSTTMNWRGSTATSDGLIFSFKDLNSAFYEARIEKQSEYTAALVLYKHESEVSGGVPLSQSAVFNYIPNKEYEIKVQVRGTKVRATVDGSNLVKFTEQEPLTGRRAGILGINPNSDSTVTYFEVTR